MALQLPLFAREEEAPPAAAARHDRPGTGDGDLLAARRLPLRPLRDDEKDEAVVDDGRGEALRPRARGDLPAPAAAAALSVACRRGTVVSGVAVSPVPHDVLASPAPPSPSPLPSICWVGSPALDDLAITRIGLQQLSRQKRKEVE